VSTSITSTPLCLHPDLFGCGPGFPPGPFPEPGPDDEPQRPEGHSAGGTADHPFELTAGGGADRIHDLLVRFEVVDDA